jgi:hypothetical protein
MRWAALTLLAMLELSAAHAQTKPDTLSDGQINEIVLCAASFEVRADLMQSWNANSYAISHERHLSSYLVDYVADHSLSRTGFGEGGVTQDLVLEYSSRNITRDVWAAKAAMLALYQGMGATGAFPPTCMEDEICQHCREVLHSYQRQLAKAAPH